jgi:hypothetical protein
VPSLGGARELGVPLAGHRRSRHGEVETCEVVVGGERVIEVFMQVVELLPAADNIEVRVTGHFDGDGRTEVWLTPRLGDVRRAIRFLDDHDVRRRVRRLDARARSARARRAVARRVGGSLSLATAQDALAQEAGAAPAPHAAPKGGPMGRRGLMFVLFVAACAGSSDAPRPIGPSPVDEYNKTSGNPTAVMDDDDNDGIPNEADKCPLAYEPYNDPPPRDGCPRLWDAGITSPVAFPPPTDAGRK